MENHPIPQDVTGFQFKLIGSMTIKQFGLLGIPVVLAFLLYYIPITPFIKYPIIFLFGITGFTLAFIPIEGRPADVMFKHFFHALVSPNQFLYEQEGRTLAFLTMDLSQFKKQAAALTKRDTKKELQLQILLQNARSENNPLDAKEAAFMQVLQKYSPAPVVAPVVHQAGFGLHLPKFSLPHAAPITTVASPVTAATLPPIVPQVIPAGVPPMTPLQSASHASPAAAFPQTQQPPILTPTPAPSQKTDTILTSPFKAVNSIPQTPKIEMPQSVQTSISPVQPLVVQTPVVITPTPTPPVQPVSTSVTTTAPSHGVAPMPVSNTTPIPPQTPDIENKLQKMQEEKANLEKELEKLREQFHSSTTSATTNTQATNPSEAVDQITPDAPHVSRITKDMAQSLGLPRIPDAPNLITGIVRDPRGNVLANMLVEVKDKEGNPVRAFKTNQLGQFISATPLLNGTYTITFEDPSGDHKFDIIEITANGELISPISVISHDAREELRKALFN